MEQLQWPHKQQEGQLAFLCPCCGEYFSAVNPRTNLGHFFHCETNFNPIDFTIAAEQCNFVAAVTLLKPMLPRRKPSPPVN